MQALRRRTDADRGLRRGRGGRLLRRGRLAQAGEAVTFIARGEHLRAICERGRRVDSLLGDFVIQPVQAAAGRRPSAVPLCYA